MKTQLATSQIIAGLTGASFIIPAKVYDYIPENFEDNVPEYKLYNDLGVYVGDVLEAKGWTKKAEEERGKTWIVWTHNDCAIEITHRDTNEYPTKVFTVKTFF